MGGARALALTPGGARGQATTSGRQITAVACRTGQTIIAEIGMGGLAAFMPWATTQHAIWPCTGAGFAGACPADPVSRMQMIWDADSTPADTMPPSNACRASAYSAATAMTTRPGGQLGRHVRIAMPYDPVSASVNAAGPAPLSISVHGSVRRPNRTLAKNRFPAGRLGPKTKPIRTSWILSRARPASLQAACLFELECMRKQGLPH